MIDYIVDEIRKIREEQAAKHHFDLDAIFNDARKRQKKSNHPTVSFVDLGKEPLATRRLP